MKVLIFTPYFGKTGSEMCLFDLLSVAGSGHFDAGICIMNGTGELLKNLPYPVKAYNYLDFREQTINRVRAENTRSARILRLFNPLSWSGLSKTISHRYDVTAFIEQVIKKFEPDVCYVNTLVLHHVVKTLSESFSGPILVHSHESENMLNGLSSGELGNLLRQAHLIITPSQKTARMFRALGRNRGVEVFYEAVNFNRINTDKSRIEKIRTVHGFVSDNFIWAMSGTIDPNKDAVAFVELARLVIDENPGARFMWLGKAVTAYADYCRALAESYGLREKLLWIEPGEEDYFNYFALADAFILTSRQDTFPLVMLEAAWLEKPLVSFDSGGVAEFLGDDYKHLIIKSRSLEEMAALMQKIMRGEIQVDKTELRRRAEQYSAANNVGRWLKIVSEG